VGPCEEVFAQLHTAASLHLQNVRLERERERQSQGRVKERARGEEQDGGRKMRGEGGTRRVRKGRGRGERIQRGTRRETKERGEMGGESAREEKARARTFVRAHSVLG